MERTLKLSLFHKRIQYVVREMMLYSKKDDSVVTAFNPLSGGMYAVVCMLRISLFCFLQSSLLRRICRMLGVAHQYFTSLITLFYVNTSTSSTDFSVTGPLCNHQTV